MNLILFQYPVLIFCAVGCAVLCGMAAHSGRKALLWLSAGAAALLLLAGLGCLLPYEELLLLLLPSLAAAFLAGEKEESE